MLLCLGAKGASSTVDASLHPALYPAERHCTTVSCFQAGCRSVCRGNVHTTALKLVNVPDEGLVVSSHSAFLYSGFPKLAMPLVFTHESASLPKTRAQRSRKRQHALMQAQDGPSFARNGATLTVQDG